MNKQTIESLIKEKWQKWKVKHKVRPLRWNSEYLRTADCHFCKKHVKESYPNEGFFGWAILPISLDIEGKAPEVCPECLKKISNKITVREPRIVRCSRCGKKYKEKIYGIGYPGWIYLPSLSELGMNRMPIVCPDCYLELSYKLGPKFVRGTWTDLTYPSGSLLTSTKMTQNQDNFTALAEGHSGAPTITAQIELASGKLLIKNDSGGTPYTIIDDSAKVWRAVYNDLAELMPASESLKPGDVLIWENGKVKKTDIIGDKRVIGVYSDTFGYCLGGENEKSIEKAIKKGYVPVAISGRVKIKAIGPVTVGDLLTTSNVKGYAMRGNPIGAVVAKALEDLLPKQKKRIWALVMVR